MIYSKTKSLGAMAWLGNYSDKKFKSFLSHIQNFRKSSAKPIFYIFFLCKKWAWLNFLTAYALFILFEKLKEVVLFFLTNTGDSPWLAQ